MRFGADNGSTKGSSRAADDYANWATDYRADQRSRTAPDDSSLLGVIELTPGSATGHGRYKQKTDHDFCDDVLHGTVRYLIAARMKTNANLANDNRKIAPV